MTKNIYNAWREFEAYAVPLTENGEKAMQKRKNQFYAGFKAGVDSCVSILMEQHEKTKEQHNIYHVAAKMVQTLYLDGKDK